MSLPLVSVLLPVRNGAAFLEEAAESILAQTLRDIEVIVVDDGSTDGTPALIERLQAADGRVRTRSSEPRGIVAALEVARRMARAPWLARMDADDRACPERLERQLEAMRAHPEWVGCGAHARYVPRKGLTEGALRYERWLHSIRTPHDVDRDLFVECPLAHPTYFLRAEAVDAVGGYRDRGWPEDYDLLLRLRGLGPLGVVAEPLLDWRDHPDRLSRTHAAYGEDAFRRCKVHHLTLRYPDRSFVVWGAGPVGKAFTRALIGEGRRVRAFIDLDPRKLGQDIHGATVLPPEGISEMKGALCLAAVGQPGAREEIRAALEAAGWEELTDFVAVA